jgi:hypothetical protein
MKIKWEIFFGNSSTEEAICLFASGHSTFNQFIKNCWQKECKEAIKKLKHRGYVKAKRSARRALKIRGFQDYKM